MRDDDWVILRCKRKTRRMIKRRAALSEKTIQDFLDEMAAGEERSDGKKQAKWW